MGIATLAIAALSVACLAVATAIVFVLRSGPPQTGKAAVAQGEESVPALAQRIRDAQPRPLLQPDGGFPRAGGAPLGRMPDAPGPFERPVPGSSWPGDGDAPRTSPVSPLPRFGSDPFSPDVYAGGVSGALDAFGPSWQNSSAAGLSTSGRIPGFAIEDTLAAVFGPAPRQLDPAQEQRLRDAAAVYDDGMRVAFDPQLDMADLVFASCPLRTEQEVALAFHMLNDRLLSVLRAVGRDRAALLVDVCGLSIRAEVTEAWMQALRVFLLTRCATTSPGRPLIARYNSRVRATYDTSVARRQIASATLSATLNSQTQVFGSREEAAALIMRLRELATVPESL